MHDYEMGLQHLRLEVGLKLLCWSQLPLMFSALSYRGDVGKVQHIMENAKHAWRTRPVRPRLKPWHCILFTDERLAGELDIFIATGTMSESLHTYGIILSLTRCNELSCEGIHRQAQLISRTRCHLEAAHLSYELRVDEFVHRFGISEIAKCCHGLTDTHILEHFALRHHPTLVRWVFHRLAASADAKSAVLGRGSSYRCIRRCFYHCDLYSMFDHRGVRAIDAAVAASRRMTDAEKVHSRAARSDDPGHHANLDDDAKTERMFMTYVCKHLQDRPYPDDVLIINRTSLKTLKLDTDVGTKKQEPIKDENWTDAFDLQSDDGTDVRWLYHDKPTTVLRITSTAPKRRRLLPESQAVLDSHMLAVVPYKIVTRKLDSKVLMISQLVSDCDLDVKMIGLTELMAVGLARLKEKTIRCTLDRTICYRFDKHLPRELNQLPAWDYVTKIVNARAVPGSEAWWQPTGAVDTFGQTVLQGYKRFGLLVDDPSRGWKLTSAGMQCLHTAWKVLGFRGIFKRSKRVPLSDMTMWELLDQLVDSGWKFKPAGRRRPAPVKLDECTAPGIAYYSGATFTVDRCYLLCPIRLTELSGIGVKWLPHRESHNFYDSLLAHLDAPTASGLAKCKLKEMMDDTKCFSDGLQFDDDTLKYDATPGDADVADDGVDLADGLSDTDDDAPDDSTGGASSGGRPRVDFDGVNKSSSEFGESIGKEWWGPFRFTTVLRVVTASKADPLGYQFEVMCPYHRDATDKAGTTCRRTYGFTSENRVFRVRQLKSWCLSGRGCRFRCNLQQKMYHTDVLLMTKILPTMKL